MVKAVNRGSMVVDGAVLERVCSAIIEDDESCSSDDAIDDSKLLDLGNCNFNRSLPIYPEKLTSFNIRLN